MPLARLRGALALYIVLIVGGVPALARCG